jgi:pseudouridine synthase
MATMRVQKYLSEQGLLSRRKAEEYIRRGKILINGVPAKIGAQIDPAKDKVEIVGEKEEMLTVLIYKPRGIVSSRISKEGKTVYELFPKLEKLHIAGRLDKESEGLLILTADGILAKKLTGSDHTIEKEYRVTVREAVLPTHIASMGRGIRLSDGMTLPAKASKLKRSEFSLTLKEGRNHQIRRMADRLHLTVTRLVRVRIGNLSIGNMREGNARVLGNKEIASLKRL